MSHRVFAEHAGQLQQPLDSFRATPSLARMSSIRHHCVSPDWSKFAPTNTVNHSQYGLTQCAKARLIKTKVPAITRIYLSMLIYFLP
jgi:hypothetical protein